MDKLANVLDYILYQSAQQYVSLREEVEFALSLIEINRLKVNPLFDLRLQDWIKPSKPLKQETGWRLCRYAFDRKCVQNYADLQSSDGFHLSMSCSK
ncbi:MAG: histidine kinase [Saprospirales bacterium]|nr:histidine kinase [Saprospirales bacterium]